MLQAVERVKREKCVRNSPANTKVREEGGREGASGTRAEISLQLPERTMMKQIFSLGRVLHWGRCTCPGGKCSKWKDPCGSRRTAWGGRRRREELLWINYNPISHHPAPLWGRKFGVRSEGVNLMLAGRRDERKVFWVLSSFLIILFCS